MSDGVGCPSCGAILADRAGCRACGPPPVPGLRGFRQTAAFLAGSAWIAALALGLVVAFARAVPSLNDAVGRAIRWLFDAV